MKKIMILMLGAVAFSWISGVSAGNWQGEKRNWGGKQSPESLVTCFGQGPFLVLHRSLAEPINGDRCRLWAPDQTPDPCAPCITSLEHQGCKVIDVVVTNIRAEDNIDVGATYMLSCVKP